MSGPCRATSESPQKETRGLLFGGPMATVYVFKWDQNIPYVYMHIYVPCMYIHYVWGPICIL